MFVSDYRRNIMYKIISITLIISLLISSAGCFTMQETAKEDLLNMKTKRDIKVYTENYISYEFKWDSYTVTPDTITGSGVKKENLVSTDFSGSIPMDSVTQIKIDKLNLSQAYLFTLAVLVGFVVVTLMGSGGIKVL